jgi:hypothetical protein
VFKNFPILINYSVKVFWFGQPVYLCFVLVSKELVAELALDVLDLQVGRVDVPFQVVALHEAGAAFGTQIRSTAEKI